MCCPDIDCDGDPDCCCCWPLMCILGLCCCREATRNQQPRNVQYIVPGGGVPAPAYGYPPQGPAYGPGPGYAQPYAPQPYQPQPGYPPQPGFGYPQPQTGYYVR